MDNLFDYLVILFFIFSALGSLFKKKPENKNEPKRKSTKAKKPMDIRQTSDYNPFDFGEEVIIHTDDEMVIDYDKNKYVEDDFLKSQEWKLPLESHQEKKFEPKLTKEAKTISNPMFISSIRSKLKEKNSLKESIFIYEILSKPKALR